MMCKYTKECKREKLLTIREALPNTGPLFRRIFVPSTNNPPDPPEADKGGQANNQQLKTKRKTIN